MVKPIKIQLSTLYGQFPDGPFRFRDYITDVVKILNDEGINITELDVRTQWMEYHRYFHTTEHLNDVIRQIYTLYLYYKSITEREFIILLISAVFHDIVYDPQRKDNEEQSVVAFENYVTSGADPDIVSEVKRVILGTKTHDSTDRLLSHFNKIDCSILDRDLPELEKWEYQIRKEYSFADWNTYKERRLRFLNLSLPNHEHNQSNLLSLIKKLEQKEGDDY